MPESESTSPRSQDPAPGTAQIEETGNGGMAPAAGRACPGKVAPLFSQLGWGSRPDAQQPYSSCLTSLCSGFFTEECVAYFPKSDLGEVGWV